MFFRKKIANIFLFFLTGCGYHFQSDKEPITLSIPFIEGDLEGHFTAQLVKEISSSPRFIYHNYKGEYLLQVSILSSSEEQIGYQKDRLKIDGSLQKNLRPIEGRKIMTAKVSIAKRASQEIIWGPYEIVSDVDYDYVDQDSLFDLAFIEPSGARRTVLSFSLGQLEPIENAQQASHRSLYHSLCQKIIDTISADW